MSQEAEAGESELEGLETVLDSCFLPALEHMDRGKSTVAALDALVVDLLSLAQSSSREQEKTFATEALESLQRQCPTSLAVTLRHYSEVYQAAQAGRAPRLAPNMLWKSLSSQKQVLYSKADVYQVAQAGRSSHAWPQNCCGISLSSQKQVLHSKAEPTHGSTADITSLRGTGNAHSTLSAALVGGFL